MGAPVRLVVVGARSMRYPSGAVVPLSGEVPISWCRWTNRSRVIVEQLNALQPDTLFTGCSMLGPLADAAGNGSLRLKLDRIGVAGDVLDRATAERAKEAFGVEPLEGYPTTDVGSIAQQAPGESGLYVTTTCSSWKPSTPNERPVAPGVLSDHLLVTSLHQRTLPMIRYRVDDRVLFDSTAGRYSAFRRIVQVDGRSDDVFRYDTTTVHPHVFRSVLGRHLEVRDYEVHQTSRGARVAIEAQGSPDLDGLTAGLRESLYGPDSQIPRFKSTSSHNSAEPKSANAGSSSPCNSGRALTAGSLPLGLARHVVACGRSGRLQPRSSVALGTNPFPPS